MFKPGAGLAARERTASAGRRSAPGGGDTATAVWAARLRANHLFGARLAESARVRQAGRTGCE
eukprot:242201-Chlamydomonas_euryale.AAC.1